MNLSRRGFLRAGGAAALAATAGCDRLARPLLAGFATPPEVGGPFSVPSTGSIDLLSHALNRLTFGARPGDYHRLRALGPTPEEALEVFLDRQLNPEKQSDDWCEHVLRRLETLDEPAGELFEYHDHLLHDELVRGAVLRAVWTEHQVYEILVRFWSDHFNIDPSKGDCKWLTTADDREVIRRHALGAFRDLLRASVLSPAMLWYLDGRVNRKSEPGERPNENHARELLELHTLGVHGGYTQQDVMEVARCLTGWTVRHKTTFRNGVVEFLPDQHDDGPKTVLGRPIEAGLGTDDVERVLDILCAHPSTARYIAFKLCRRFIDDQPPPAAVDIVAKTFATNGGDIPSTLRALFATTEFRAARGTKFKRPFHFVVSALRATGAETDVGKPVIDYLLRMGHAPFNYPSPDGYPLEASPWMGSLLWRWNFALALAKNRISGTRLDRARLEAAVGGEDNLVAHILGRRPSPLETECYAQSGRELALLLASPSFQWS